MFEISTLLSAMASTGQIASALIGERDQLKLASLRTELTQKIIESQALLSQLLGSLIAKDQQISVLSEDVRQLKALQQERERYVLAKLGSQVDLYAYRLRPAADLGDRTDEPSHYLCQPCFDAGRKAVLRGHAPREGSDAHWTCPNEARHQLTDRGTALEHRGFA
jgi:hypothetical protein